MMRKLTLLVAALAAVASIAAAPAGGAFCYDLDVNVNGDQLVGEADCVDAP